jgi:arylsulfatase A-like enzyme
VLLIVADDMRPELGCYGCAHMKTPHIDALAADAVTFTAAYVAVAWCSPSRTALLVSRRPDTSRTWSVSPSEYWRQRGGNFTTLPQLFKSQGFETLGCGKVFHPGSASGSDDYLYSWSPQSLPYDDAGTRCPSAANPQVEVPRAEVEGRPLDQSSQKGNAMGAGPNQDTALASCAVRTLQHLANRSGSSVSVPAPFFFAVGFHKPRAFAQRSLSLVFLHF